MMSSNYLPGPTVAVPEIAYKSRVQLPAAKTAVIVVDMQNDFVMPGGTLVVPDAAATVPNIQRLLAAARQAGVRVAYTQDTHFEGDPEWQIWPEHCRQGSWGWQIVAALAPQPGDLVEQKSRYDGFYDTSLDHYLSRVWRVEHLVIAGTVASICVLHTAASAGLRWFHVVLPADGASALTPFDQALALRQVSWLYTGSVTRSVDDVDFTT
jgi:nicotinamidase-related amidase